jgi:ABC-type branched-subunit amino acid transport system substrate-binding protein
MANFARTCVVSLGCVVAATSSCASNQAPAPVKIGVLLPLTGDSAMGYEEPLDWARDTVNAAGGVRGRPIELVYVDTGTVPRGAPDSPHRVWEMAQPFLTDPDVQVVIGTDDDDTALGLVPSFLQAKKLLITPAAAGANLTRAFPQTPFLRRTIPNDAIGAQTMVAYAAQTGAKTVSVVTTSATRGSTFFDWVPFHAEEAQLTVNAALQADEGEDCTSVMTQVLGNGVPDLLMLVPGNETQAECMVRQARMLLPGTRLLIDEPMLLPELFSKLGSIADGIEGLSVEAPVHPVVGPRFDDAYAAHFGHAPPPLAADAFDAVALGAYALTAANGASGDALASALDHVVGATGEKTAWDGDGLARALQLIAAGGPLPDVTGATGELSFAPQLPLELTSATLAIGQISGGKMQWQEVDVGLKKISFPDNYFAIDGHASPFEQPPSDALLSAVEPVDTGYVPAPRHAAWAFVAALSSTMENYRHQADALAMYQLLKKRGFDDDHIVLVLADDIADASDNPQPGTVYNAVGGANVHAGDVAVDYNLSDVTPAALLAILQGNRSDATPAVVESTANDDVFVYWVGHGGDAGVLVGDPSSTGDANIEQFVTPFAFASAIQAKFDAHAFRQMVVVLESCHSGAMGTALVTPGVVLLTGATPFEDSFATNFDPPAGIWEADTFAFTTSSRVATAPDSSIQDLYTWTYRNVRGSHPRMYNAGRFGGVSTVTIGSILSP